jgi:hypothetical protein
MNAYELADIVDRWAYKESAEYLTDAAKMLRQQADRIAELEKSHIELEQGIVADLNQRQSAEPVAWMSNGKEFYVQKNYCPNFIPLYTTPQKYCPTENNAAYEKGVIDGMAKQRQSRVDGIIGKIGDSPIHDLVHRTPPQIKELSDAEIRTIQDMCHLKNVGYNTFIMRFARAILKKASEK